MPIQSRLAATMFAPEQVSVIVAAFDGAWQELKASNSYLATTDYVTAARDMLAKRIIDQALAGILDAGALKEDALGYVRQQLQPPQA
jgi:hypothetical protein